MRRAGTGITINPIRTMMNHATTELFFDDLRVPAENLIGEEGRASATSSRHECRAHPDCGRMHRRRQVVHRKATAYAKERIVFGRPIGQNQGVQFPIARAYAQMRAAELMVREARSLYEAGRDCGAEANMAKLLAAEPPGRPPTCACRPTAASALPRSSTSSASSARRGSIRSPDLDQPDPVLPRRARPRAAAIVLSRAKKNTDLPLARAATS
jgi:hypothetical protein